MIFSKYILNPCQWNITYTITLTTSVQTQVHLYFITYNFNTYPLVSYNFTAHTVKCRLVPLSCGV